MNKILRFSFISLLMMLCGSIYADETTIWSEDWQSAEKDTKVEDVSNANATYKGDNGAYVKLYANANDETNMELLVPKSSRGVNFQADVKLNGETSMTLTFDINNNVDVTSTTSGAELTKVSNTEYTITVPSGTTILNLTFTMAVDKNGRLDNILLVSGSNEGGGGDTPVTPDPQPTEETVTLDFDADYATLFPTLPGVSNGANASQGIEASTAGDFTETTTSAAVDGVTVTVEAAESGTANRIWNVSPRLRLYSKSITIKSEKSFNKIVFSPFATNSSLIAKSNVPSSGAFEGPESQKGDVTWTGAAVKELTITIAGNTQIGKMVITMGEGGSDVVKVPVPTITGTAEFTDKTTVTIKCADEDAAIYYTIDGSDPKTSSTVQNYSEPFELTETATVKAYVEDVEGNTSDVVEKTFTKKEAPAGTEAANIAEFLALPDKTQNITLTLTNARVLAFGKNNIIVNDGTGGMDIYKLSGVTVKQGDILNGTVTGPRSDYNNVPELNTPTANTITVTESTITATKTNVAAIAEAGDDEIFTDLFKLENVEVVNVEGKFYIKDGDQQIQLYTNQLGIGTAAAGTFTIEGVVGRYKTDKQFWPTSIEATQPIQVEKVADIAALKALDKGTNAELTLTDAQVLYAWKSNNGNIQAYVRDASGAMCFDFRGANAAAGEQFETNKIVNGTIMLTNSLYNGLPQASAYADTNDENLTFDDGSEAQAVSTTIPNVKNYICDLVEIEIDEIVSDGAEKQPKYYAKSGSDQIQIYNQFHVADYEDLSKLVGSATTIKGIAVIYQKNAEDEPIYEIYPVADGIVTGISEVNVNAVNDGKIYNLAGQQVGKNYKGIVVKNGRKYIVK